MEENEEEEIADVDAVSVRVGRDVVIGRKWRTKMRRKIKELEKGIKREERYLEKELSHKVWCANSKGWRRTRRKKLMMLMSSLPVNVALSSFLSRFSSSCGRL